MFKGLFDVQTRLMKIDSNGDMLDTINKVVDWELFRPDLEPLRKRERKSSAGRKPYDLILMFKIIILQELYNLSDDRVEKLILDRLTFMRFLGLGIGDDVPDSKTIWLFRESMKPGDLARVLFERFQSFLRAGGYEARRGQMVDATIVSVPTQRNSRDENKRIKGGEAEKVRAEWSPAKAAQKDTDARWTKKNGKSHFGYKQHNNVDVEHKLVRDYSVTPANVHDSQEFAGLLVSEKKDGSERPAKAAIPLAEATKGNPSAEEAAGPIEPDMNDVYADSAYRSTEHEALMESLGLRSHVMKKGTRAAKLTEDERAWNHANSKVRVRVEHVFGSMRQRMGCTLVRTIGLARATIKLGLRNLAYNIERFAILKRGAV